MQRVVEVLIGPAGGHGDDAVVGLAQPAQPLPSDVRGRLAVLAVARVVDHQHPAWVRGGRGIGQQQFQSAGVDLLVVPGQLGQEELQPLYRGALGPDDGFGAGQAGQGLVPVPRQQQSREVLAEPAALCQRREQVIEARGVGFQSARSGRTRQTASHHKPPGGEATFLCYRPTTALTRRQQTTASELAGTACPEGRRSKVGVSGRRQENDHGGVTSSPFDIDVFLSQPLTARVATDGPTVRPVWFVWEEGAFWILTGPWAKLFHRVSADPRIALVVDVCDVATGLVRQVIARGRAELVPFDVARGRRKLVRYLGPDESRWDTRFVHYLRDDPKVRGTVWLRLVPSSLTAHDLSYAAVGDAE